MSEEDVARVVQKLADALREGANSVRLWLPLWLFLIAQLGAGLWWMATVSADVRSIMKEQSSISEDVKILDLKVQKLTLELALATNTP